MIRGLLPAVYLDRVESSTYAGILVANEIPERDSIDAAVGSPVVLEILSTLPEAIDRATVRVYLDGSLAFEGGGAPEFLPGYDGPGSQAADLDPHDLRVEIDPLLAFTSEQVVAVRVVALTVGATGSCDFTYTFTVEDTIAPVLTSVRATFANLLRVTFSEAMLASSSTGAGDALNPTLYSVRYVQQSDREAGINAAITAVRAISDHVFELTTDLELTFGRRYALEVGAVVDDSANANPLDPAANVVEFDAWFPPDWPPGRRFVFWEMLSDYDRENDTTGDLERFCSILQDTIDLLVWDCDRFSRIWDVDKAPIEFVELMLEDLGNPFDLDLTETKARKLAGLLVPIYQQKGTARGIVNALRFLIGVEVTIGDYTSGCWILGDDELGVGTYAGPASGAAFYTFAINVPRALTDEERRQLRAIVDYMKPAHTHYRIVEPAEPGFVDHWELGLSLLGESTALH